MSNTNSLSKSPRSFKICSLNVNHLKPKLQEIRNFITENNLDILFVQETLLYEKDHLTIPGYTIIRKDIPANTRTGGVCTILKDNIHFTISNELDMLNKHLQAIKLNLDGMGEVVFVNYYQLNSEDLPKEIFQISTSKFKKFIILGDLNSSNVLFDCSHTNKRGKDLFEYLHEFNLSILNNEEPTFIHRIGNIKPNILDFFISNFNFNHTFYVGDDVGSDHFPIHLDISSTTVTTTKKLRNYKKADWNLLRNSLSLIKTPEDQELDQLGIDLQLDNLEINITAGLDLACPKKEIKTKSWWSFTPEIKEKVKERRKLKRKLKTSNSAENRQNYNKANKLVRRMINDQKHLNWKEMSGNLHCKTPTLAWQTIRKINEAKTNPNTGVKEIKNNSGKTARNDHEKAKLMAEHLKEKQSLPTDPRFSHNLKAQINEELNTLPRINEETSDLNNLNSPVTASEILKELKKCKSKSAAGEDEINYLVLKNLPYNIYLFLAFIFTQCIKIGYFPKKYKKAIVIMLPKPKKDKSLVKNFRPVSLLSCVGKLLERIMKTRLINHFNKEELLNKYQYGFMPGKSTSEHIFRLSQDIHNSFKKNQFTIAAFLDIEGAFDTVFIPGLIYKLYKYRLPNNIINFLTSFIKDRSFRVKVGNSISDRVHPESGTPQGSVLSPLLFNIFTNDIPPPDNLNMNLSQYADDIAVWISGNSQKHIQTQIQKYLDKLAKWCNDWFIKINPDKTQVVCFTRNRKKIDVKLTLLNQPLTISPEATFLGVTFDKGLTWATHAQNVTTSIWRKTNILRSLVGRDWGARGDFLVHLYKQWAIPNLTYSCLSFANLKKTHYKKMEVLQNSLIRAAYRKARDTKITELLEIAQLEPISKVILDRANKEFNRIRNDCNLEKTIHLWRFLQGRNKQTHLSPLDAINRHSHINF